MTEPQLLRTLHSVRLKALLPIVLPALAVIALTESCGHGGRPGHERKVEIIEGWVWQTAWVDPRIVRSDTLLTLIQAGRVDSLQVDPAKITPPTGSTVEFHIESPVCDITVSLLDSRSTPIHNLLSTTLLRGYYKISLSPGVAKRLQIVPGQYQLRVSFCGRSAVRSVTVS